MRLGVSALLALSACGGTNLDDRGASGDTDQVLIACGDQGLPTIVEILSVDGETIWETGDGRAYAEFADGFRVRGNHLCDRIYITDTRSFSHGITPVELDAETIEIDLPWDMPAVDLWIYFVTLTHFAGVECSVYDIDGTRRQLFVRSVEHREV